MKDLLLDCKVVLGLAQSMAEREGYDTFVYDDCIEKINQALRMHDVSGSLLSEFAEFILHNANWSESYADKPWYSENLEKNVSSNELSELFLNSR